MSKVTVIIPVYNGATFLPALLDSVIGQTSRDWTCICVNDGSADDSLAILKRYAEKDTRILVIDQPNGGCGTARNSALARVSTPYLMFADQDDLLHPQTVETAVSAIESSSVDCLCFGFERFRGEPSIRPITDTPKAIRTTRNGTALITGKRSSWPIFVWRHIFRTDAVRGIPFPPISGGEDQAWMSELSWNNLSWASIDPVLYFNRERPNSQSRGISRRYIDNVLASYRWIDERSKRYGIDRKWVRRYIRHMRFMFLLSVFYRSPRMGIWFLTTCVQTNHRSA